MRNNQPPNIDDYYTCLQCGYCKNVCPVYNQLGWESATPRGKVYWLKQLSGKSLMDKILRRKIDINDAWVKRIYSCTSCAACEEYCHVNLKLADLWEDVKEWMLNDGVKPLAPHKMLYDRISDPSKRNPFQDDDNPERDLLKKRGSWLPEGIKLSRNPEVVFFAGCTSSYRLQMLAQSAATILDNADVKFSILGKDEWCCGSPLLRTGQTDIIKGEYAEHNVQAIEARGVHTVVTACAGCFNTLKNNYPKIVGKLPFKVYHISEFLEILHKRNKLKFKKEINKTITFHDPCHLGRHGKVFDAPRYIIRNIPGVKFVEMDRIRKNSRCCGAGGGFKIAFNDIAEDIAVDRVKEAQATGAELIVTPCPFCVVNLNAGAKKGNIPLKSMDLLQFVTQAI
ncbi:MAG: (Fe-S)-binding protein [Thermoplasmata archaeon]|nr:MAG: (Fe-S)-binding protein [Thermoplasmata archaeon]